MNKKIKICPKCHTHNAANAYECVECSYDLTNVQMTESGLSSIAGANGSTKPKEQPKQYKICSECGSINSPQARKCISCGEDLSDVPVSKITESEIKPPVKAQPTASVKYQLTSLDGTYRYTIPEYSTSIMIGRDHTLSDYLMKKMFVSREQAVLTVKDGTLFLRNISKTNPTFLNNMIIGNHDVPLAENDEIGLGGKVIGGKRQEKAAYLLVKVQK